MQVNYYNTDLGVVVKDNNSIRLKSSYTKRTLDEKQFNESNPIKIKKQEYLEKLNIYFRNTDFEWVYNGQAFRKLPNFQFKGRITNYNELPNHSVGGFGSCIIVMYHGRLYYTFFSGNYIPKMPLIDFKTKELTGKWTHIKNLAPVYNIKKREII